MAEEHGISKQSVRKYLCEYLAAQDIRSLAPQERNTERALTKDEKNMRKALNKYYYTTKKRTLKNVYTMMLRDSYCDGEGKLFGTYPSFYQFRYFFRKYNTKQTEYISRNGLSYYQRNQRPLVGDGVQAFAPNVGVGMLDATVLDIYLINEFGGIVGRPILTACVDAYSGLCCGYSLSWEGGVYSLRNLMLNVITDKVEHCRSFGIEIDREDWNCSKLLGKFVTDMGSEYKSGNFEQITDLGVQIINLPFYRPGLKSKVEKFFDCIQGYYKNQLKGKGVVEPDFQERGVYDYRKDACLTMADFEKIIIHCILFYNNKRVLENFPYTEEMLSQGIKPYANEIWNYGCRQDGCSLISVSREQLILTLLPRAAGKFTRYGLAVNGMHYHNINFREQAGAVPKAIGQTAQGTASTAARQKAQLQQSAQAQQSVQGMTPAMQNRQTAQKTAQGNQQQPKPAQASTANNVPAGKTSQGASNIRKDMQDSFHIREVRPFLRIP